MPMKVRRPVVADLGPERDARSICSRVFLLLNVRRQNCSHRNRRSCTYRIWNSPFANVRTICGSLMVVAMDGPTHTDTHTGWLHSAKSWRDLLEVSPVGRLRRHPPYPPHLTKSRGRLKLFQREKETDARLKGKVQPAAAEVCSINASAPSQNCRSG